MSTRLPRVALAQLNPTVGDLDSNAAAIRDAAARASGAADIVLCGELGLPGYPAEDLYLKRHFLAENVRVLEQLARDLDDVPVLVGFAEPVETPHGEVRADAPAPRIAHNALALLTEGRVAAVYRKNRLPNYGVFDEARYFEPGSEPLVIEVAGTKLGLTICEDMWEPGGPASREVDAGAAMVLNASGSPYLRGKGAEREAMFARRARELGVPVAYCNLFGAQDELVFDGHSFALDSHGGLEVRARQFAEDVVIWEPGAGPGRIEQPLDELDEVLGALTLGIRDYVHKNDFATGALVGLSGGIDSALVALLAAEALGAERLACVVMPSPHSSAATQADARTIARNLGAELIEIPVTVAMDAYAAMLEGSGGLGGLAAENVQARIRGNVLMALSNSRGSLVLTTGNKSEMAVGYTTLYGDMAGGLAVIKDVPKSLVYRLVDRLNERAGRTLVPASVLERAPSAELRPGQRDEDSLPPYDVLDQVLEGYIEQDLSASEIAAGGIALELVEEVIGLVDRAEYKRRQAPPGIRITSKAFGRDRRLPITNRFRG